MNERRANSGGLFIGRVYKSLCFLQVIDFKWFYMNILVPNLGPTRF